jgi:hypothetical protein
LLERTNYIVEQLKQIQDAQGDGCIGWSEPDAVVDGLPPMLTGTAHNGNNALVALGNC